MNADFRLGLVIHAVNLPVERERILASFRELGSIAERVKLAMITEADYADGDMEKFNPARAKNIGLKKLLPECDGVVCIDADYIIPPGLFDLLIEPAIQPFHIWVRRRDCTAEESARRVWREWLDLPVHPDCWGSCNYMSAENWLKAGGWDERTYGWGGDDDLLHIQIGKAGIERRRIDTIPLMHIRHGLRPWSGVNARGKQNIAWAKVGQPNYLEEAAQ